MHKSVFNSLYCQSDFFLPYSSKHVLILNLIYKYIYIYIYVCVCVCVCVCV